MTNVKDEKSQGSKPETMDLVIDHELIGVTPEMIDWWWMNMVNSDYYKLWHPEDHVSIEWEVPPVREGNIGAIHIAEEKIGEFPVTKLRIKVIDPATSPIVATYTHVRATCTIDANGNPATWIVHEYESQPGGTRMRSTFRLPADSPREFVDALRKHNKEEMGQFPKFLPGLYRQKN
jgi:hypothetical protein